MLLPAAIGTLLLSAPYTLLPAAAAGNTERCRELLSSGQHVDLFSLRTAQGSHTALHRAAIEGHLDTCKLLVSYAQSQRTRSGDLVDATTKKGFTALHLGAFKGHCAVCSFLVSTGASLEARNQAGKTPLQVAEACHHEAAAALLREAASAKETKS